MGSRPCPPPWLPSPERAQSGEGGSERRSPDPEEELRERGSEVEGAQRKGFKERRRGTSPAPAGRHGGCPFPAPAYQGPSDRQNVGGSHSPTSLPSPWPPAALASPPRGAEACASVDSAPSCSSQTARALAPALPTGSVTRTSGSASLGLACQVAFRCRTSKSEVGQKLAGNGPPLSLLRLSRLTRSGGKRNRALRSSACRSCSGDSRFGGHWSGEPGAQAEPRPAPPWRGQEAIFRASVIGEI